MSFNDLKSKIRIKAGESLARTQQEYESLVIVISKALGGSTSKSSGKPIDPAAVPQTADALEATLAKHMR
jgi:hypothetical protein